MAWSFIEVIMPDYIDGQDILSKRPEPGRLLKPEPIIIKETPREEPKLDANAIIEAVIKGVTAKMPKFVAGQSSSIPTYDDFDNSSSLDKLADAMAVSKKNEGKVDGIGIIKETKRDSKEINATVDLLSNLGDEK